MVMMTNPFVKFANQPTNNFFERLGGSTLRTPAPTITFQDDFDYATQALADASWVSLDTAVNRVNITNDNLDVVLKTNNSDDTMAHDLGSSLSDSAWVCRFKWNITGLTRNNTSAWHGWIGLSSTNQTGEFDDSQDSMGLAILTQNTGGNAMFWYASGSSAGAVNEQSSQFDDDVPTGTYYIEIIRNTNVITVNVYTDSNYLNLFDGGSNTITGTVTGLQYFKVANKTGNYSGTITSTIDDLKIYNGVTELSEVGINQHFIEWFSGKQLPSYWTKSEVNPPASFAMNDSVDGGFRITAGGNALNEGMINFNNKRVFSKSGCVCIWVGRDVQTSSYTGYYGLANGITGNDSDMGQLATIYNTSANGVIALRTGNTTKGNTESTISLDTNFHTYKIEMKTSSAEWSVDGVAQTTRTLTLPTLDLQPVAGVHGNNKSIDVRYCEAYNT